MNPNPDRHEQMAEAIDAQAAEEARDTATLRHLATGAVLAAQTGQMLVVPLATALWLDDQDEADWAAAITEAAEEAGANVDDLALQVAIALPDGSLRVMTADGDPVLLDVEPGDVVWQGLPPDLGEAA